MKHVKTLTNPNAIMPEKALDSAGSIFLEIWLTVFTAIVRGAFDQKR